MRIGLDPSFGSLMIFMTSAADHVVTYVPSAGGTSLCFPSVPLFPGIFHLRFSATAVSQWLIDVVQNKLLKHRR